MTAHLSQEEAASALGVSQRTISNWRAGKLPDTLRPVWKREIRKVLESGTGEVVVPSTEPPSVAVQINEVLARRVDEWATGYLIGEIRAAYRDAALAELAIALRKAEENAALLSEERRGHRDAILQIDQNATDRLRMNQTTGWTHEMKTDLATQIVTGGVGGGKQEKATGTEG